MQTSELPDLAHTDTKPLHWLATAAAMAAVVAAAGLLQPDPTASASTPHRTTAQHGTTAVTAPDPARADFPLECGGVESTVAKQATGDLDGDGRPETVAVVHCAAGLRHPAQRRLRPHTRKRGRTEGRGDPGGPRSGDEHRRFRGA